MKIYTVSAIAAAALLAACSNEPATTQEADIQTPAASQAPVNADDDTLEPAPPVIEEGEEHDESEPHTH